MSTLRYLDGAKRSAFFYSISRFALFAAKFGTGGFADAGTIPDYIFEGMPAYLLLSFYFESETPSFSAVFGEKGLSFDSLASSAPALAYGSYLRDLELPA